MPISEMTVPDIPELTIEDISEMPISEVTVPDISVYNRARLSFLVMAGGAYANNIFDERTTTFMTACCWKLAQWTVLLLHTNAAQYYLILLLHTTIDHSR